MEFLLVHISYDPYVPAVVRASVISMRLSISVNVLYYGYSVTSCRLVHYL